MMGAAFNPTGRAHVFVPGDYPVVCDKCGDEYMRSQCNYEPLYDNRGNSKLLVCPDCLDQAEPALLPPNPLELRPNPDARPSIDRAQDAPSAPALSSLTPSTRTRAQWAATPTFLLAGVFRTNSQVWVNGERIVATVQSATSIQATLGRDQYAAVGTLSVMVVNAGEPFVEENGVGPYLGWGASAELSLGVT